VEYAPVFSWIIGYWWVVHSRKLASAPDGAPDAAR
jgi:hypothetical protein